MVFRPWGINTKEEMIKEKKRRLNSLPTKALMKKGYRYVVVPKEGYRLYLQPKLEDARFQKKYFGGTIYKLKDLSEKKKLKKVV